MGLADIARAKQIQKQLDRLQSAQDAEERDRHAYKFATYQGKDPVDGTDIVEVDGVKTSGFKLMSNAPLSIGDRVNLRPNQQGLQRVDAQNVAPVTESEALVDAEKFVHEFFFPYWKYYVVYINVAAPDYPIVFDLIGANINRIDLSGLSGYTYSISGNTITITLSSPTSHQLNSSFNANIYYFDGSHPVKFSIGGIGDLPYMLSYSDKRPFVADKRDLNIFYLNLSANIDWITAYYISTSVNSATSTTSPKTITFSAPTKIKIEIGFAIFDGEFTGNEFGTVSAIAVNGAGLITSVTYTGSGFIHSSPVDFTFQGTVFLSQSKNTFVFQSLRGAGEISDIIRFTNGRDPALPSLPELARTGFQKANININLEATSEPKSKGTIRANYEQSQILGVTPLTELTCITGGIANVGYPLPYTDTQKGVTSLIYTARDTDPIDVISTAKTFNLAKFSSPTNLTATVNINGLTGTISSSDINPNDPNGLFDVRLIINLFAPWEYRLKAGTSFNEIPSSSDYDLCDYEITYIDLTGTNTISGTRRWSQDNGILLGENYQSGSFFPTSNCTFEIKFKRNGAADWFQF